MKVIDLTHTMHKNMPVFPGTEKPIFLPANTIEKDGFKETKFTMYSHTGTHIDAPGHMKKGANLLDQLSMDYFIGRAAVLDFSNAPNKEIGKEDLLKYANKLENLDFVLIMTGHSKYWDSDKYFEDFAFLSEEAADFLISLDLKGIGIDAISIDYMEDTSFKIHHKLFENNMIIIENLTNLESVKDEEGFIFSCLPLKYENADGSPVRAVAILAK